MQLHDVLARLCDDVVIHLEAWKRQATRALPWTSWRARAEAYPTRKCSITPHLACMIHASPLAPLSPKRSAPSWSFVVHLQTTRSQRTLVPLFVGMGMGRRGVQAAQTTRLVGTHRHWQPCVRPNGRRDGCSPWSSGTLDHVTPVAGRIPLFGRDG